MMRKMACVVTLGLMLALGGCDSGAGVEQKRIDALTTRVEQLEKRLSAVEGEAEPAEGLRTDVTNLDRRTTALEGQVREMAARPAAAAAAASSTTSTSLPRAAAVHGMPSGPAAWGDGPTTREERQERRDQLRDLTQELRKRLAQNRGAAGTPEQQQQIQDTLTWYREQRRLILRGEPRTDQ